MNYGITLLKCFYGNDLKIINDGNCFHLPKNKIISENFRGFLSQCLYRDISRRSNWYNLSYHCFVDELQDDSIIEQNIIDLIGHKMLGIIFGYFDKKFMLINEYYEKLEFNENTEFINQIEVFLNLVLYEELIILQFYDRSSRAFTPQNEISFLLINNNGSSRFNNINYGNHFFQMEIGEFFEFFEAFICKLKDHIKESKKICLNIHKITKSNLFKGNYFEFLQKFIEMIDNSKFISYFLSIFTNLNKSI